MTSSDSNGLRGHYPARRDVEKSATADAHISQLRHEIESRLRISLPEDISSSLADGVILCHIANHVRPRAVPSIHVPSPSVVSKFLLHKILRSIGITACKFAFFPIYFYKKNFCNFEYKLL